MAHLHLQHGRGPKKSDGTNRTDPVKRADGKPFCLATAPMMKKAPGADATIIAAFASSDAKDGVSP